MKFPITFEHISYEGEIWKDGDGNEICPETVLNALNELYKMVKEGESLCAYEEADDDSVNDFRARCRGVLKKV